MLIYLGKSILLSDPNGIMFAAMLVPRIDTSHVNAERNTANLVLADQ